MRTTVEIPDDLFRQLKAKAALEGRKLKEVIVDALRGHASPEPKKTRVEFPIVKSSQPGSLTSEMVRQALEEMDAEEAATIAKHIIRH